MHVRNADLQLYGVPVSRQFSRISRSRLPSHSSSSALPPIGTCRRLSVEGHRRPFTRWRSRRGRFPPFSRAAVCRGRQRRCEGRKKHSEVIFVWLSSENVVDVLQEPCTQASVELLPAKCSLSVFYTNLSINGLNVGSTETHAEPRFSARWQTGRWLVKHKHMQFNLRRKCDRIQSNGGTEFSCEG